MRGLQPENRFRRPLSPGGFFRGGRFELTEATGSIYNPGRQYVRCHNNLLDYFNDGYGKY